ncbi:MAG: hypothetical protein ACLVGL_03165 [Waltera sp.]
MAKKFGKFLLFTAAVGTAAAAAYYYMQQKDSQLRNLPMQMMIMMISTRIWTRVPSSPAIMFL